MVRAFNDKLLNIIEKNKIEIEEYKEELKLTKEKLKNIESELIIKDTEISKLRDEIIIEI